MLLNLPEKEWEQVLDQMCDSTIGKMDKNKDGNISLEEYKEFCASCKAGAAQAGKEEEKKEKQIFTDFKSEFDKLDVNKDGKLDKKELR